MHPKFHQNDLFLFQIEQIENYLREGKIAEAIIFYQEITKSSLTEAEEVINNWILPESENFTEIDIQERAYLYFNEKGTLYAIKCVKEIKKIGLKEAIEYVNELITKRKL